MKAALISKKKPHSGPTIPFLLVAECCNLQQDGGNRLCRFMFVSDLHLVLLKTAVLMNVAV